MTGVNTLGQQYRNHAVGCEDEYDHPGSCRPFGEYLMPDDRKSDHDVPIRDIPFVKLLNIPGFQTNIVHIEAPIVPVVTGDLSSMILLASLSDSPTLCSRLLIHGSYYYPQSWCHAPRFEQWTTCKTCHRVWQREVANG